MSTIFWFAAGALLGWSIPQPQFVTDLIAKVKGWFIS